MLQGLCGKELQDVTLEVTRMDIYRTAVPMRKFEHAAASRQCAEAVICRLEYADGVVGWGETHPRRYVTGETIESVISDLEHIFWPQYVREGRLVLSSGQQLRRQSSDGRCCNAAACAFDLAAARRYFDEHGRVREGVLRDLTGRVQPRRMIDARVSGVLGSSDPAANVRALRKMWLFGLRDFKLKLGLGDDVDAANLDAVHRRLAKPLATGKATLRVDVNGAWDLETTPDRVGVLRSVGVCAVEQPVYCPAEQYVDLAGRCSLPLIADESLLTERDAAVLARLAERVWWNIRISKNGGLAATLKLAGLAARSGVPFVLGCMVGESSILSAAQRRVLQWGPVPRFTEGNYGRFLLKDDLTRRSLRFGYGGKLKPLTGPQLGVSVDRSKIARYAKLVKTLQP